MSFFSSIGQYVADSVAGLSLSPKRFSLSRQGSSEAPATPATPGPNTQAPPSPAVQHGFPKVVPSPGATALGGRRRTLECLAPPAARPPRGGSLRRTNRAGPATPGACSTEEDEAAPHTVMAVTPQHRPPLAFCRRRLSWPEVDQHATSGVQETDGSYFESFTALSWKQENRRLGALRAGEARAELPPPSESALGLPRRAENMPGHERESLYVEVLYTIANTVGAPAPGGQFAHYKEDLHLYAQRAFEMSPERHYRLLNVAGEEKPPIVVLSVVVLEADGLEAKDANGFSDPYCMLGIQPMPPPPASPQPPSPRLSDPGPDEGLGGPHDKLRKHHSFRLSFKRRGDGGSRREHRDSTAGQLPAKFIRATSVKPHTLSPKWNEKFRFDIDDVQSDTLHLDIWDHDDESSVLDAVSKLNEVRGVRGLGRFFKQVCQSARQGSQDDFLGSVNVPLHEIPSTGMEGWFKLEARSQRSSVQGRIRLRLWLSTREDRGTSEEDNWTEVRQQEQLFALFLGYECRQAGGGGGPLSGPAATILHQHAVQGDLSALQVALAHWAGAATQNTDTALDPRYMHKLLSELEKVWCARSISKEEEQWLAESFTIFLERSLLQIKKHRELFPALHPPSLVRLEGLLRCLNFLSQMKAFWKCCPFNKEIRGEIVVSLRKGTAEWYARLAREGARGSPTHLLDLSTALLVDLQQGLTYYHPLFETTNSIPYFSVVYKQIDKMLADDVCRCLNGFEPPPPPAWSAAEGAREPAHTLPFELYLGVQEVRQLAVHVAGTGALALGRCHEWFGPGVERWLAVTRAKALHRVRAAMALDRVCEGEFIVKHSTSSVDTAACFYQAREFWRLLCWPNTVHALQLLDALCAAAMHYADLAHQRLADSGYYDFIGPYKTTDEMCVAVNNLEYVRRSLAEFGEDIKPDQAGDSERARVLDTALQALETRAAQVLSRVAPQMEAPLRKAIFHLAWSPDSLPTVQAITPLLEYLDIHLATLNAMLLPRNFSRVLGGVWAGALRGLAAQVDAPAQDRPPVFHDRLQEALDILTDFFHAEGKGLAISELHSDAYCRVEQRLQYHKTPTERLIDLFYGYRLQDQLNTMQTPFGILSVRAYFNHDSLCVEVLSARDVLPLDPNGFSDPFVIVELLPRRVFAHCAEQQTNVHKKTLNPIFDECFEFSVTLEQCLSDGSMVAFTVMDHDVITANDFAGEAFLPLANIPGVADSSSNVDNFHGLKQVDLPLLQQYDRQHPILQILESRIMDRQALEFVKKQKLRFAQ